MTHIRLEENGSRSKHPFQKIRWILSQAEEDATIVAPDIAPEAPEVQIAARMDERHIQAVSLIRLMATRAMVTPVLTECLLRTPLTADPAAVARKSMAQVPTVATDPRHRRRRTKAAAADRRLIKGSGTFCGSG